MSAQKVTRRGRRVSTSESTSGRHSVVAHRSLAKGSVARVVKDEREKSTTPSVVSFMEDGMTVGYGAVANSTTNPGNTVYTIKRLIGHPWTAPSVQ